VFAILKRLDCIVAGDLGCYTLGALGPYEAMDTNVAMGASVGVGLGLRHVLPDHEARRVVSLIGDSTFVHSGVPGLIEMVYNPPPTGHVVIILDNGTTAMTGLQESPATGRRLDHTPTGRVSIEGLARALGIVHTYVVDPVSDPLAFEKLLRERLNADEPAVVVARRDCILLEERTGPQGNVVLLGKRAAARAPMPAERAGPACSPTPSTTKRAGQS
jgi:indolepyruvate ferredoxin oxidoreductase alpha subunit